MADGVGDTPELLRLTRRKGRRRRRPEDQNKAERRDSTECDLGPEPGPGCAEHGAEQRPSDRRAHGDPEQLAPPLSRSGGDEPGECASPRDRAAEALAEAGCVEAQTEFASPKATLVTTMIPSPMRTVGFTPRREARRPPGMAPARPPAA